MFFSVPAVDANVIMYHYYSKETISNGIHMHLEYVLGHFDAKWHAKEAIAPLVCV